MGRTYITIPGSNLKLAAATTSGLNGPATRFRTAAKERPGSEERTDRELERMRRSYIRQSIFSVVDKRRSCPTAALRVKYRAGPFLDLDTGSAETDRLGGAAETAYDSWQDEDVGDPPSGIWIPPANVRYDKNDIQKCGPAQLQDSLLAG
ncbi:hypothetical protein BV25DRAFT_1838977 [Artomyces pyxidatus]|uniref:Uncharacterized protein n=1 Tax=Artomyces pyxidatus TaxID=48021 RepID=A0ACB8SYD9_9AGAM|nr:hypothetical protein BV25DRAFT_1838977 [Artomyces pyxidatus]